MDIPFELDQEQKQIKQKIFPYLKALLYELALKQPINIEKYMIDFLTKYGNYTASGLTIEEKKELESLRIAVKHYRDMEKHDLVKSNSNFNKNNVIKKEKADSESSDSDGDVMDDKEEQEINSKLNKMKKTQDLEKAIKSRSSVSAEVYGFYNKKEKFVPKVIPKNEDQMNRIKGKIISSFIFSSLEKKDLDIVINAMEEKRFKLDDKVIIQGEDGDCLYIVETGSLKCFKTFNSESSPRLLKTYEPGDSFGELALLYNCPRAATIICSSDESILWSLDRETFNHIVKDAAQKKREKYENFLKNVDILSTIDSYELGQICDSLKDGYYKKDDYIIREGELGDVFYILEEGNCNATKTLEPGKPETVIKELKEGDYFGERALLKGEPRYANIVVTSETAKVISLDRLSFNRLLGPILEILKRNIDKYQVYCVGNNDTIENPENNKINENNTNSKSIIEVDNKENNNNVDDNTNNENNINKENDNNNNIDDNTNNKNENENENNNNTEDKKKMQNLYSVNDILTANNNENSTSEIQIPVLNIPVTATDNNEVNDEKNEKENEKNDSKEGDNNKDEDKDKGNYNNIDPNKDLNSIITGNEQIINNANEENENEKKEEQKDNNVNAEDEDKKMEENNIDNQNEKEIVKIEEINNDNQNEKEIDKNENDNSNNNENNNNLTSLQDMLTSNKKNEDSLNNNEDAGDEKNENSPAIKFSESIDSSENNVNNNKDQNQNQDGNENNVEENPNNEKPLQPLSDKIAPNEE